MKKSNFHHLTVIYCCIIFLAACILVISIKLHAMPQRFCHDESKNELINITPVCSSNSNYCIGGYVMHGLGNKDEYLCSDNVLIHDFRSNANNDYNDRGESIISFKGNGTCILKRINTICEIK
jgi:hypothetical protein